VIAPASNAAPPASPLDLLAAPEAPGAAPKTNAGSHFHSLLKAATDEDERPKSKSAKKDSAADGPTAIAVPVPGQRTPTLPITFNLFPGGDMPDKKDGENPEAASTNGEKPKRVAEVSVRGRLQAEGADAPIRTAMRGATEIQDEPDQPARVDASEADGSLSKIAPAFEMHLQAAEPQESASADSKVEDARPATDGKPDAPNPPAAAGSEPAPAVTQSEASTSKHGDSSHHPAQERTQEAEPAAPQPDVNGELAQSRFDVNASAPPVSSPAPQTHAASRSETPAPAPVAIEPPTPAHAAAPAAHDIKLELNTGGGQRVEVRLTERDGDIRVAVRTPDARLSEAMRADLPALAAKLEQSGFRADAGHPFAATGEERRTLETADGNASQDSHEHAGRNPQEKQENPQQQQQRNQQNAPNYKSNRKDFAWLLQTYR
jgi:hypothetical protein